MSTEAKAKVSVTINGKALEVPSDYTVFQAAEQAGIFVPHYCYHPDLSIAGVCRMCLVEIDKVPKLQISCNTPVRDGMVVHTDSERAKAAQKGSLELHLINHPLDCPICDKAGECKLQDFYRGFGLYKSRMDFDNKVNKPKVVDIGTIVLDSERCILCSRCVRFTDEVTHTHELVFLNRGDRTVLQTYDQQPLRNDYTGNLADICPVGALTAKDFRFQQRVWFLDKKETVCTMCARGCNTEVSYNPKTKKLYRVEPRRNPEVNQSWICDTGRWRYHYIYSDSRIRVPQKRHQDSMIEMTWEQGFREQKKFVDENAKDILVGLSTQLTNEEIVDAVGTLTKMGVKHFGWLVDEPVVDEKTPWDGVLKHHDHTPNARGFQLIMKALNQNYYSYQEMEKRLAGGDFKAVWLLGLEGEELPWVGRLVEKIPSGTPLLVHGTSQAPYWEVATTVFPATSSFEKTGSLVNVLGRLQRLQASVPKVSLARDLHDFLFGLQKGNDRESQPPGKAAEIFEARVAKELLGHDQSFEELDPLGVALEERQ